MLLSYTDLRHFEIAATDGRKGHAEDFYFDDESWRIRYLVTESGFLFNRQQGLVKSTMLERPDPDRLTLPISLTKEQLDAAEAPDTHPPKSKQNERAVRRRQFEYWPPLMLGVPGAAYTPVIAEHQLFGDPGVEREVEKDAEVSGDPHLRSMSEILGYAVGAQDGEIGAVIDFLLDPDGWTIRHIVVDTGAWLRGRQVVIEPGSVSGIVWADRQITVEADKETVENAPGLAQLDELHRIKMPLAAAPYGYGGFPM